MTATRTEIIKWFRENYEDVAESTPMDDGEYVYIWGEPEPTRDLIESDFPDLSPELLDAIVDELERDGTTEWVPVPEAEEPEPDEPEEDKPEEDPEP
jgi:hypothetical protein